MDNHKGIVISPPVKDDSIRAVLRNIEDMARSEAYTDALRRIDELAAQHPNDSRIWRSRTFLNSHQGNTSEAIADASKAIELCGLEPDYFYTRGILYFQDARYLEAISDFTRTIELCDFHRSDYYREGAYFFRADSYLRLRMYDKARSDCANIRDGMQTWTDSLRSKENILAECK